MIRRTQEIRRMCVMTEVGGGGEGGQVMSGEKVKESSKEVERRSRGPQPNQPSFPIGPRSLGSGWTRTVKKAILDDTGFEGSSKGRSVESKHLRLTAWAKAKGSTVPRRLK